MMSCYDAAAALMLFMRVLLRHAFITWHHIEATRRRYAVTLRQRAALMICAMALHAERCRCHAAVFWRAPSLRRHYATCYAIR